MHSCRRRPAIVVARSSVQRLYMEYDVSGGDVEAIFTFTPHYVRRSTDPSSHATLSLLRFPPAELTGAVSCARTGWAVQG
jgi:hypothetical protein